MNIPQTELLLPKRTCKLPLAALLTNSFLDNSSVLVNHICMFIALQYDC